MEQEDGMLIALDQPRLQWIMIFTPAPDLAVSNAWWVSSRVKLWVINSFTLTLPEAIISNARG
jgi:hypothetical protein